MPASLPLERYVDTLTTSAARLKEDAAEAGWSTVVPTCPEWTVLQLVAHQGMVYRWAASTVAATTIDRDEVEQDGLDCDEPGGWLLQGADLLAATLRNTPPNLDVPFFLCDAPSPLLGWARRQAHESTIHGVDALAARLGNAPSAEEIEVDADFAADGVDELLMGFLPHPRSRLYTTAPTVLEVLATDTGTRWMVHLCSDAPPRTTVEPPTGVPDVTWRATAAQLYLAVWNRGSEVEQNGGNMLGLWQELVRIT